MKTLTIPLGEVCEFVRGVTFPSGEGRATSFENSIACLTTSGVQREVNWRSRRFIRDTRLGSEKQVLRKGDILISTANSKELVGKSCLLGASPFRCTFGAFVTLARSHGNLDSAYLAFWMKTERFLAWCFQNSANTTNISNLRVSELAELEIPLPDLAKQRQIVATLEQADRLRRTRRYALELGEEVLPATFREWFANGHAWPVYPVEELAAAKPNAIRTGPFGSQLLHSEFTASGVAVLGIDNAVNNQFEWQQRRFISPAKYEELKRYTVHPGDLVITIMGTCGRCAIVPDGIPTAINSKHLCCITLDQRKCLPIYLQMAFLHDPVVQHSLGTAQKGAIMDGLNMEIIRSLCIPLPPLPLQQRFAALVARHERLRARHREALRQADHLFQTLLHRAFASV